MPGIGKATAGSIRAFAWNEPEIFIETNIRRVFIHFFFLRAFSVRVTDAELMRYIKRTLPRNGARMVLGAYGLWGDAWARNGAAENPNRKSAHYKKQPRFSGSDRELRGKILRSYSLKKETTGALGETERPAAKVPR